MRGSLALAIAVALGVTGTPAVPAVGQMDHNKMPGMHHEGSASPTQAPTAQAPVLPQRDRDTASPAQRDTMQLQEAENPSMRTGAKLPAPDLLRDAATRAAVPLQQWQDWAEAANPTLAQARAQQARSEQMGRQAGLPPNPTVGYSGEHIRGGSYGGGEQGAYVQQTIVLGGKLGLRSEVYRQQAAADRVGTEEQRVRVRADVQRAFYRALAAQARVHARQQLVAIAENAVETAHLLANLGQADSPEVLQAEVEAEQATLDFVSEQREYLQDFGVLRALCNQPDLPVSPLAGDLEQVPEMPGDGAGGGAADAAVAQALAESPSMQRAQQQVRVAEARLKQQRREPVPNVNVQAGEWYSNDRLDGTNKVAGWMSFGQVGVELPLWNRNQGGTGAAGAQLAQARSEVTRTQLQIRQNAAALTQDYLTARFQAERYRTELLPRAQRAYELYNMKYQQMAAPYTQVLMAQHTLFTLRIAYLHALEEQWVDAIALQNYTLQGGLEQPSSMMDGRAN